MKTKRIFAIIAGFLMGAFLAYTGAKELVHSIQLQKRGKATTAQVLSRREYVTSRLRMHSYYLTISFSDDAEAVVHKEVRVSEDTYNKGHEGGTTKAFYLPEASAICAAGDVVELRYGHLLFGLIFLGGAAYLLSQLNKPSNMEELAERVEEKLKPMMALRHEYAPAQLPEFNHLDIAFYEEGRRFLETQGYSFIGDRENVTLRNANGRRTLLRLLLSGDQTTQAFLYHFKVSAAASSKDTKVLDVQTQFSNGAFVCTSNAKGAGNFDSPPTVSAMSQPDAGWETVLETHTRRVNDYLKQNPGISAVKINGSEQFQEVMDALQKLRAEFRRQQGISQAELERISGKSGPQIQQLAEILKQRWAGRATALAGN